jgi:hypothetical protein
MKKIINSILKGLLIFLFVSCTTTEPVVNEIFKPIAPIETSQLITFKKNLQDAFTLSDTKKIEGLISPKYLKVYKTAIEANPSKLPEFGNMLKTMKVMVADSIIAVYQIEYKGSKFEITINKDDDGTWKLIKF